MKFISQKVGEVGDFLALPVENIALLVLEELRPKCQYYQTHGVTLPDYINNQYAGPGIENKLYAEQRKDEVCLALAEAWGWLATNGFLAPHPRSATKYILTRRAEATSSPGKFNDYRKASSVPWDVIHSTIRDLVRGDLLIGKYDGAILEAFKRVEIAVRDAAGFPASDIGISLMRAAFKVDPPGPLTDAYAERGEKEALGHLFAGAMGYLKNPHSHRIVNVDEISEAVEVIMFASHLLRIVDSRKSPRP